MIRSIEYPKTENLWKRDEFTHKLIPGEFRNPGHALIKHWHVTEKIDGTNIRVLYKPVDGFAPAVVEVRGRSDRANVHKDLIAAVKDLFPVERLAAQFDEFLGRECIEQGASVTIFGEGYGAGIQKGGGNYSAEKRFRMFDVMYHWPTPHPEAATSEMGTPVTYHDSWCQPSTMSMIASGLGVPQVPILGGPMSLDMAIRRVNWSSLVVEDGPRAGVPIEGIIARTDPYLYTERGSRVMFKLKGADLAAD